MFFINNKANVTLLLKFQNFLLRFIRYQYNIEKKVFINMEFGANLCCIEYLIFMSIADNICQCVNLHIILIMFTCFKVLKLIVYIAF